VGERPSALVNLDLRSLYNNHHDCFGLVLPCAVRVRLTPGVRRPWPRYGAIFTSMSFLVLARFAAFALARLRHRILPSVNQRRCTLGLRTAHEDAAPHTTAHELEINCVLHRATPDGLVQ
jgi:hypothetical protein